MFLNTFFCTHMFRVHAHAILFYTRLIIRYMIFFCYLTCVQASSDYVVSKVFFYGD